ncbi:ErfK/YbiS/YcfS/YnhG family protein [Nitrosococcus watsonii C-113]|uniref:ErfK/YbiS/YcfS/YnhG family protein n=1 Tax=Nitrosococcus watsoni (strain C-113) TaxID=105559 RepID=D8K4E7_NITWC|nr:ErfK/YbiS/YcfS/YnhG family protein [Nitrosococcus watsonii C-113]
MSSHIIKVNGLLTKLIAGRWICLEQIYFRLQSCTQKLVACVSCHTLGWGGSSLETIIKPEAYICIYFLEQRLILRRRRKVLFESPVSLAKNGLGEEIGSECTPRGWHQIRAKVGAGCPVNTVFRGRRPTGEIYTPELGRAYPERDWILTRILWLGGLEAGKNRFGRVDTLRRYIYIHGVPDAAVMGLPGSHGCIRIHNGPVLELFKQVRPGMRVFIS